MVVGDGIESPTRGFSIPKSAVSGDFIRSHVLTHHVEIACLYRSMASCAISCDPARNGHRTGARMDTGTKSRRASKKTEVGARSQTVAQRALLTARNIGGMESGEWAADPAPRGAGVLQVRKLRMAKPASITGTARPMGHGCVCRSVSASSLPRRAGSLRDCPFVISEAIAICALCSEPKSAKRKDYAMCRSPRPTPKPKPYSGARPSGHYSLPMLNN